MILNFIFKISSGIPVVKKIFRRPAEKPRAHEYPPPWPFSGENKKWHRRRDPTNITREDEGGMAGRKPALNGTSKPPYVPAFNAYGFQGEIPDYRAGDA
jgi:hypothetical protein